MKLRTITRSSAALGTTLLAVGGVIAFLVPGAGALEQERVVIDSAEQQVIDYGPIVGDNPGANADGQDTITSDTCQAAGCDVIPLTIKAPPGVGPDDDYFVHIQLEWDTQEAEGVPLFGTFDVNDLDLWMTNDPVDYEQGSNQDGFTYFSAGSHQPEQITMYKPTGDWNIFVVNSSGVNTGYRLKFDVIVDSIPTGFLESLPPAFTGGGFPAPRPVNTTPATADYTPPPPPPVDINPATPPKADTSFQSSGAPSLDDQLAAPPTVASFTPASVTKPSAPSGIAILLWMFALPLLIVALGGAFLLRRQRSMLQI